MKMPVSLILVICAAPISLFNLFAQNVDNDLHLLGWLLMIASAICLSIERAANLICHFMVKGQVFVEVVKKHREMEKEK